jgi:hypothetical protein
MKAYDEEIKTLIFQRDSEKISSTLAGKLAILLHDAYCGHNHTDACGWMYDVKNGFHNWEGHPHGDYLAKAKKIIEESKTLQEYNKT